MREKNLDVRTPISFFFSMVGTESGTIVNCDGQSLDYGSRKFYFSGPATKRGEG